MFFLPEKGFEPPDFHPDPREHPDYHLALEPSDDVGTVQEPVLQNFSVSKNQNIVWCLSLLGIFFFIHVLRTDAQWSLIGFISPFTAVIGDAVVALLLALGPQERTAWTPEGEPVRDGGGDRETVERTGLDGALKLFALHHWVRQVAGRTVLVPVVPGR